MTDISIKLQRIVKGDMRAIKYLTASTIDSDPRLKWITKITEESFGYNRERFPNSHERRAMAKYAISDFLANKYDKQYNGIDIVRLCNAEIFPEDANLKPSMMGINSFIQAHLASKYKWQLSGEMLDPKEQYNRCL